jgi:hypothetical protein
MGEWRYGPALVYKYIKYFFRKLETKRELGRLRSRWKDKKYCHDLRVNIDGFGFVTRFIDHLYTQLDKQLQRRLSLFPACCVFISRSLATVSNSGDSLTSHPPAQN